MNGTVSDLSIVFMAISCLFGFGLPIVLLLYFRKKFKADFMAFVVGGAVMFLFALVLEATVHQIILATPAGKAVLSSAILYAVYGGFMAALFEETGRFLAMKTILRPYQKKDVNALMYGAGHGGIEAAAILGIGMINNLIWSVMINTGNQGALTSSATGDVLASIQNVITALVDTPAYVFLLGSVERVFAVALQIAMSVLVWFAVKKKKVYLFAVSFLIHFLVDAVTSFLSSSGVSALVTEGVVGLMAVAAVILAKQVWKMNAQSAVR